MWKTNRSLNSADRIRRLQIADTSIIKQDGMAAPTAGPPQMDMGGGAPPMGAGAAPLPGGAPPPKSALGEHLDQLDSMTQDLLIGQLGGQIDATNQLLSQARAHGIDPGVTMTMQMDIGELSDMIRQMAGAITAKISLMRTAHASVNQHGPASMGGPMMGDPMAASMGTQPPMNMPTEMPPGPWV